MIAVETVTKAQAGEARPLPRRQAPATPEFRLGLLRSAWSFDEATGDWLPEPRKVPIVAGVNGVDRSMRIGPLINQWRDKGGELLDLEDPRLGKWGQYMLRAKNDAGHSVHFEAWVTVEVEGRDVFWGFDQAKYNEFRRYLLDSGIVAPIHDRMKAKLTDKQAQRVNGLRKRFGDNPSHFGVKTELQKAEDILTAMEQGCPVADVVKAREEASKPKRGRKPAAS